MKDEERQVKGDSRDVMTKRHRAPGSAPTGRDSRGARGSREGEGGAVRRSRVPVPEAALGWRERQFSFFGKTLGCPGAERTEVRNLIPHAPPQKKNPLALYP